MKCTVFVCVSVCVFVVVVFGALLPRYCNLQSRTLISELCEVVSYLLSGQLGCGAAAVCYIFLMRCITFFFSQIFNYFSRFFRMLALFSLYDGWLAGWHFVWNYLKFSTVVFKLFETIFTTLHSTHLWFTALGYYNKIIYLQFVHSRHARNAKCHVHLYICMYMYVYGSYANCECYAPSIRHIALHNQNKRLHVNMYIRHTR